MVEEHKRTRRGSPPQAGDAIEQRRRPSARATLGTPLGGGAAARRTVRAPLTRVCAFAKGAGADVPPHRSFDARRAAPAFVRALEAGRVAAAGRRALVPGAGRGYDLELLVRNGAASVTGLEISPSAVAAASAYLDGALEEEEGDNGQLSARAKAAVVEADFFTFEPTGADLNGFDLVYDYTFFCALEPGQRDAWAARMGRLVKPGGNLVTLMFPLDGDRPGGPPFSVSKADYLDRLANGREPLFAVESVEDVPAAASHPERGGREALGIFTRC